MRKRVMSAANGRAAIALTAVVVGLCGIQSVLAQGSVTIDVGDCIKLKSPEERLACYERQVDAAAPQKAAPPAAPPAAHSAASPAPTAVPPATASQAAAPSAAAAAVPAAAATVPPATAASSAPAAAKETQSSSSAGNSKEPPPDIVATITALHETVPNAFVITLDNGQVWRQSYPESYFLRPGMRVTLRSSKWGSAYRLNAEGLNGFIQVQRVK